MKKIMGIKCLGLKEQIRNLLPNITDENSFEYNEYNPYISKIIDAIKDNADKLLLIKYDPEQRVNLY